jgi:hypothetical protein
MHLEVLGGQSLSGTSNDHLTLG